nr:MAG TPA: hypothetical protein [Caudoviricetes sp.]
MKKLIDLFFRLRDKQFENHFVQELVDAAGALFLYTVMGGSFIFLLNAITTLSGDL